MSINASSCFQSQSSPVFRIPAVPLAAGSVNSPMYYHHSFCSAARQEPPSSSLSSPTAYNVLTDVPPPRTHTLTNLDTALYDNSNHNPHLMKDRLPNSSSALSRFSDDELTLTDYLDRTLLDLHFDLSCLEDLDDQLLLAPIEAFAAICWADAVDKDDRSKPWPWVYSDTQRGFDSNEESQSDETDVTELLTPAVARGQVKRVSLELEPPEGQHNSVEIQTRQGRRLSFVLLTPPSALSDPKYSVHYFPTSPRKTKKPSSLKRLANGIRRACLDSS